MDTTPEHPVHKPTIIEIGTSSGPKATEINIEPAKPFVVTLPTSIGGTVRVRIPVTLVTLSQCYPKIQSHVLSKALDLILKFNIEDTSIDEFILWGQPLQEKYSQLIGAHLSLSMSEIKVDAVRYINRLQKILQEIEYPRNTESTNTLLRIFAGSVSKKINSSQDFESTQIEVNQLAELLSLAIKPLTELYRKQEGLRDEFKKLQDDVEISAIAAEMITDYMIGQKMRYECSQALGSRTASLYTTQASLMQQISLQSNSGSDVLTLISCIQNIVLTSIPTWLNTYADIIKQQTSAHKPTVTVIDESKRMLNQIVEKLTFS